MSGWPINRQLILGSVEAVVQRGVDSLSHNIVIPFLIILIVRRPRVRLLVPVECLALFYVLGRTFLVVMYICRFGLCFRVIEGVDDFLR